MAYRKLQFPANVQKGMQFDLHGYFDSCLGIQTISITKSSLTSAPQVKINTCIFPLETNFKIMLCTSQSKSPPPPTHGNCGDLFSLDFDPPAGRKSAQNSRSSPTRPGSKRGLHYPLISSFFFFFFFAPHGNFAYIIFFSCVSIEMFTPVYVQNKKMLCKVFRLQCTSREFCLAKFPIQ